MALADLLKPTDPALKLATLRSLRLSAQNRLADAQSTWAGAVADEAEGYGGAAATDAAEKALHIAKRDAERADTALRAVEGRFRAIEDTLARDAEAERWARAERLAVQRTKKAQTMGRAVSEFATAYKDLLKATLDMDAALPAKPDRDAAMLMNYQLETAVRVEMRRQGVDWAAAAPLGVVNLPDFMPPFDATPGLVRGWKEQAHG